MVSVGECGAVTRSVRYTGRNHDTPRYMPVTERENIMPMQPYRSLAQGFSRAVVGGGIMGGFLVLVITLAPMVARWFA